jgi:hypothetical protein
MFPATEAMAQSARLFSGEDLESRFSSPGCHLCLIRSGSARILTGAM